MKRISFVRIGMFATSLAALSVGAFPSAFQSAPPGQTTAKVHPSVSGKVSAVSNDGFSLDVKVGDASSTLQFVIDLKTKVTGIIKVGADVSVEYRNDADGRNIANSIVVATKS